MKKIIINNQNKVYFYHSVYKLILDLDEYENLDDKSTEI